MCTLYVPTHACLCVCVSIYYALIDQSAHSWMTQLVEMADPLELEVQPEKSIGTGNWEFSLGELRLCTSLWNVLFREELL